LSPAKRLGCRYLSPRDVVYQFVQSSGGGSWDAVEATSRSPSDLSIADFLTVSEWFAASGWKIALVAS
jgi:hypothetical protein